MLVGRWLVLATEWMVCGELSTDERAFQIRNRSRSYLLSRHTKHLLDLISRDDVLL